MVNSMTYLLLALALWGIMPLASCTTLEEMQETVDAMNDQVEHLEKAFDQLSRQLMLQQLYVDEQTRSREGSGLKQTRQVTQGTFPYHATTATVDRIGSIHEHANNIRVVGMGELVVVLNGLEFRTRHNDYKLVQPEETESGSRIEYDTVRDIPFPEVPKAVTEKEDIQAQVEEMREWFKAWKDQDYSVRDYREHFKAILCYLEGAWTVSDGDALDESFDSDRHFIDASSWHDLQDKVRFTSYGGRKDSAENYAYLPTTIMSTMNGSISLAQWNYRIVCHPIQRDLPTNRLKLIDDITSRIGFGRKMETHGQSRAARFRVAPVDKDTWREKFYKYDLLDELMGEIPGKDGYGNDLTDTGLDNKPAMHLKTGEVLSAGFYHRWFSAPKDAMGSQQQHRAFSDENLFMAKTTQEKVAEIKIKKCEKKWKKEKCQMYSQRWSYAIPLEIIYLTPLNSWNPHGIDYKGFHNTDLGKTVTADGQRTGKIEKALNGTNNKFYYITPIEFFSEVNDTNDKADTAAKSLWVLNRDNEAKQVAASGTRILLPDMGSGKLRTRYPIMPLSYEGSACWKELTALKHITMEPSKYKYMFYDDRGGEEPVPVTETLLLQTSNSDKVEPHEHRIYVDGQDLAWLCKNNKLTLRNQHTDESNGHSHKLTLMCNRKGEISYTWCDKSSKCWDEHPTMLEEVDD